MPDGAEPLGDVIERVRDAGQGGEISVAEVVDALGSRGHFAVILVIAAVAATPLSGIPGVSVVCGLLIGVVAAERLIGDKEIYIPSKLRDRSLDAEKVRYYADKLRPVVEWIDRHTRRRFEHLFHRPLSFLPLLICIVSGFAMPFLEFIPFSSSIVAAGVLLIALAFVTRDGLLALLSTVPYLGVIYLLTRLI